VFEELFQDVFSAESNDDSSEVCSIYVVFNMLHIDASILILILILVLWSDALTRGFEALQQF